MARFVSLSEIGWILASADKRTDQFDSHAIAARVRNEGVRVLQPRLKI
jgi:hypothetical protein